MEMILLTTQVRVILGRAEGRDSFGRRSWKMGNKARVMVVEDDATLRETLAELLEIWGYQAATASDGIDALKKMRSFRPRVVISDLQMPRMGGMKLLQAVRDSFPDVSCIIVTGERSAENASQASAVGAFDLLEKPIDPLRLQLDLQKFLGHPRGEG
jgi:DNA-binding NtrC family response regulator